MASDILLDSTDLNKYLGLVFLRCSLGWRRWWKITSNLPRQTFFSERGQMGEKEQFVYHSFSPTVITPRYKVIISSSSTGVQRLLVFLCVTCWFASFPGYINAEDHRVIQMCVWPEPWGGMLCDHHCLWETCLTIFFLLFLLHLPNSCQLDGLHKSKNRQINCGYNKNPFVETP